MKFPSFPVSGKSIADDFRALLNWCRAKQIISIKGGRLVESPNGTSIVIDPPGKAPRPILPPFWVSIFLDGSTWKYRVSPGYVTFQNIGDADVVNYYCPTLGGTSLEADTQPEGTLPANACYIYVRVVTNAKGVISATPTVAAYSSEQTSTHHVPPDEEAASGTQGEYFFLIAEFEEFTPPSGDASPDLVRRITGNRFIPNQLVELKNIGAGRNIHCDYVDGSNDKHELRSIIERASSPQIRVKYDNTDAAGDEIDAEEILIEGNGYDFSGGGFVTIMGTTDGLVTSATDLSFGLDETVDVTNSHGTKYWTLTFEKGLLTNATETTFPP